MQKIQTAKPQRNIGMRSLIGVEQNFTWMKKLQRKYMNDNLQICCQIQAL